MLTPSIPSLPTRLIDVGSKYVPVLRLVRKVKFTWKTRTYAVVQRLAQVVFKQERAHAYRLIFKKSLSHLFRQHDIVTNLTAYF